MHGILISSFPQSCPVGKRGPKSGMCAIGRNSQTGRFLDFHGFASFRRVALKKVTCELQKKHKVGSALKQYLGDHTEDACVAARGGVVRCNFFFMMKCEAAQRSWQSCNIRLTCSTEHSVPDRPACGGGARTI